MDNTQTTPNANPDNRDAEGRFGKGNRGGPGNPFARQSARLRQAALDATSPEDIAEVIAAMKKKACEGDVAAAKLLLSYTIGKPTAAENPDTLDQQEFKIMVNNTLDSAEGPLNIVNGMPLDLLVEMFRLMLPALRAHKTDIVKTVLCAPLTEEEKEDAEEDVAVETEESGATDAVSGHIPDWMMEIGKEAERATPQAARKRGRKANPQTPTTADEAGVDAELLRVMLERARHLAGLGTGENGHTDTATIDRLAELLRGHGREPSPNGANGHKPPKGNGSNGMEA